MAYEIKVEVDDVVTVKLLYNEVHLYRFESEAETDAANGIEITQMSPPPTKVLNVNYFTYIFVDAPGSSQEYWYRARYEIPVGLAPPYSSFSEAIRAGTFSKIFHRISYPDDIDLSDDEDTIINKIRILIGDRKQLIHDYISTCKSRLSDNDHTIEMKDKGWPVYINLNGVEKTRVNDPYIDGYRYLTFSGSIGASDVIDIYCYTFRNSDSSINDAYSNVMIPPGLTSATVTQDHFILQTAITLLEGELISDAVDSGVKIRDGDTNYDPTPSFSARQKILDRLRKRLDDLITQYLLAGGGVLID
ncbi:MAG: hypothetical protein JRJ85_00675 [Deltaproteobacteria bacterium]|nr:hypothetical protein [Deltaproteobacteria bacterium]